MSKYRAGRGHFRNFGGKELLKLQSYLFQMVKHLAVVVTTQHVIRLVLSVIKKIFRINKTRRVCLELACSIRATSPHEALVPENVEQVYFLKFRPRHAKKCLWAYADSEGPDQPAHVRSLIRVFPVR